MVKFVPQFQPVGSDQCCQACIASISGLTTAQVCRRFNHWRGTSKNSILTMLRSLGIKHAERQRGTEFMHCKTAIVAVRDDTWIKGRWHCILWHDGKFFCPTDGMRPHYLKRPTLRFRYCIEIL